MEAVVPFDHFGVVVVWDPKHKPKNINNSRNNKQKADFVFFILKEKELSDIFEKLLLTSSWFHMTAKNAKKGKL